MCRAQVLTLPALQVGVGDANGGILIVPGRLRAPVLQYLLQTRWYRTIQDHHLPNLWAEGPRGICLCWKETLLLGLREKMPFLLLPASRSCMNFPHGVSLWLPFCSLPPGDPLTAVGNSPRWYRIIYFKVTWLATFIPSAVFILRLITLWHYKVTVQRIKT